METMVAQLSTEVKPSSIRVISVKLVQHATIKAVVDIQVGGVKIIGAKIIQQAGQKPWLALPAVEYLDAGGTRKFAPTMELSADLKRRVEAAVLQAWEGGAP